MGDRLLATYLNDHLAVATAEVDLARRSRGANEDSELGTWLGRLCGEVESDRQVLTEIMAELDVDRDHVKVAAGWLTEKVGRLKLNGQLTGYSPLSRLVELDALQLTTSVRLGMWQVLHRAFGQRLGRFDLPGLIERADSQRAELERRRLDVGGEALFLAQDED